MRLGGKEILTLVLLYPNLILSAAEISGNVSYKGRAIERHPIRLSSDPVCMKEAGGKTVFDDTVVVNKNGGVENVFIYIKEGAKPLGASGAKAKEVVLDQIGCRYNPHVWGVQVNQTFTIINSDPTLHNVHFLPKDNPSFNIGMANKGMKVEKKFSHPETMIRIKCDVHGWMHGYVGVLEHPYFTVTDANGSYKISELPPGDYVIAAWHEKFGEKIQKISVQGTGKSNVNFEY